MTINHEVVMVVGHETETAPGNETNDPIDEWLKNNFVKRCD